MFCWAKKELSIRSKAQFLPLLWKNRLPKVISGVTFRDGCEFISRDEPMTA